MHLSKMSRRLQTIVVSLCFIFSIFFVYTASADDETYSLVCANFDIEFETATDFKISVEMDVQEINDVFDTTYNKAEIKNIADTNEQILGAIKLRLRNLLKKQIESSFVNANVGALNQIPEYKNDIFEDSLSVNLTSEFFGINESVNSHNFINGILDMGAIVAYVFDFQAEHGWNNTYAIMLTSSMTFHNTTGSVSGNQIQWETENWDGNIPSMQGLLSVQYVTPTTPKSESEDIVLEFELDARSVNSNVLDAVVIAESIDIGSYDVLPSFITNLEVMASDGIRLFVDNGLISWDDVYQKTIKTIEKTIVSKIENSSFNQTLNMIFSWDLETTINCSTPYDIINMDNVPPLNAKLSDEDVDLRIFDVPAKALFGLVNAGAVANVSESDVNFGDKLNEVGYPYTCFLYLPNNISLDGENPYGWNYSAPISGEVASDISPTYSDEDIEMRVDLDITKTDLNLLSFFTGRTELTTSMHAQEEIDIYVTTIPDEFSLPKKLCLDYLNSDAFRLCIEEQVFNGEDADNFLTNKKQLFEKRVSDILDGPSITGHSNKDVFFDSLEWDGDISNMDSIMPVAVSSDTNCLYSIPFSLSFWPPGFDVSDQNYNLVGLDDAGITYRILFPKGITVEANDTLDKSITHGETEDDRRYIEITFDANESKDIDVVTCKLSASTLYALGLFLPCILSLVLVIILIIVIYIIRKKRGKLFFARRKKDTAPSEGYEGEEFYVPPPPSSK